MSSVFFHFFFCFFENDLSNVDRDKVLKVMFLNSRQAKEGFKEFKTASFHLLKLIFFFAPSNVYN